MVVNNSTPLIRLADLAYPRYTYNMRLEFPNVSFPDVWADSEGPKTFGYDYVIPTTRPTGEVVVEGPPVFNDEDSHWYQVWTSRDFTPEEIAQNLADAKNTMISTAQWLLETQFLSVTQVSYKSTTYGTYLQPADLCRLQTIKTLASEGSVSEPFVVRFEQGVFSGTATEADELITEVFKVYYGIISRAWAFMADVESKTNIEEIPPLPGDFLE